LCVGINNLSACLGDDATLESGVQVRRRSLRFYLLIVVLVSLTAAMAVRVFDAYVQGDVWLRLVDVLM